MKETEELKTETVKKETQKLCCSKRGLVWPLILISIGALLLLNNLGILPWTVWDSIWKFWPVILVFVGVNMIFGESGVGSVLVGIIFAVIIFFIVALIVAQYEPNFGYWMRMNFPEWNRIQGFMPMHNYLPPDRSW